MVVYICIHSSHDMGAGRGPEIQDQPQLQSKSEASLGYMEALSVIPLPHKVATGSV